MAYVDASSDDLPLWGMIFLIFTLNFLSSVLDINFDYLIDVIGFVGEMPPGKNSENGKHALYTHKSINVKYNKDQVGCFFAIKQY